jgi:hypothetical protein
VERLEVRAHQGRKRQAAGVREQLAHGDAARFIVVERGEVLRDGVVEGEAAFVDEDLHRRTHQRLRHRTDAVDGVRLEWLLAFPVPQPHRRVQHSAAILDHQQLAADDVVVLHEPAHHVQQLVEGLR